MDRLRRKRPNYTSIELVSNNASNRLDVQGTIQTLREPAVGFLHRILPSVAILLSGGCAAAVWSLRLTYWKDSLGFYTLVTTPRVGVQVFIGVLSSILTVLWTYGVCQTINLLTRSKYARQIISINKLRLYTLISQARLDLNLPLRSILICSTFCFLASLPTWLWTGALTPQVVDFDILANATLPKTGNDAYPFLNFRQRLDHVDFECWIATQANGTFTSCPGEYQSGNLLRAASLATTIDDSPRNHSKYDNTGYNYIGRSYGAGASVGLTVQSPTLSTLESYSFTEHGYSTTAACKYNSSSTWQLSYAQENCTGNSYLPCLYMALGCFPNSNYLPNGTCAFVDGYAQASLGANADSIVAMGSANSDNVTEYYLTIAAGPPYEKLNQIQCQLLFTPKLFAVNASSSNATISGHPIEDADDPEPRGMGRSKVMDALNVISMVQVSKLVRFSELELWMLQGIEQFGQHDISQTTLYVSTVGEALMSNVRNYVTRASGPDAKVDDATGDQILDAVKDSMEAMADDILASFAAAALTRTESTQLKPVYFTAKGVEIGEYPFIIAVLSYQILALIGVVAALVLTNFWLQTPAFDYTDVVALSTAASLGAGPGNEQLAKAVRGWQGRPNHPSLGSLRTRYRNPLSDEPPIVEILVSKDFRASGGGIGQSPGESPSYEAFRGNANPFPPSYNLDRFDKSGGKLGEVQPNASTITDLPRR